MSITAIRSINAQEVNPTPLLLKPLSYCGYALRRVVEFSDELSIPDNGKVAIRVAFLILIFIPILVAALIGIAGTFSSYQPTSVTFTLNTSSIAYNQNAARYISDISATNGNPHAITERIQALLPKGVLDHCTNLSQAVRSSTDNAPQPLYAGTIRVIDSKKTGIYSIIDCLINTIIRQDHSQIRGEDIISYMQLGNRPTFINRDGQKNITKQFIRSFKSVTLAILPPVAVDQRINGNNFINPITITLER